MEKNVIKIKNLNFMYNNEVVLDNINFNINSGDFLGLIGQNGSGKTTLLKLMLGLIPIQEGEITLFGESISKFSDWNKIGYVSQKANSFNSGFPATVYEVVSMGIFGKKGVFRYLNKADKARVLEAIETVGLTDYINRSIGKLSGGQQQRTFIAKALVSDPELLILDEPTVGVDEESTNLFYELLDRLNKKDGITVVLVSHDINMVKKKVSVLTYLNKRIDFQGHPDKYNSDSDVVMNKRYFG